MAAGHDHSNGCQGRERTLRLRFWLADHRASPILALLTLAILGSAAAVFIPLAPASHVVGTIDRLLRTPNRSGSSPVAYVHAGDREVAVSLPRVSSCALGARIHLWRQRRLWGFAYGAEWPACAPGPRN
jgi:hypothetical protein